MFEEDQKSVWETGFPKNGMGPQVVVEGDPASDIGRGLRPGFPRIRVDIFTCQRPTQAFDKDVVQIPGLAVHRDLGLAPLQPVSPVKGRELRPMVGVHDLGRAKLVDGFVQRFEAELGLKRVRDAPGQHLAGEPVHDGHQIKEPLRIGMQLTLTPMRDTRRSALVCRKFVGPMPPEPPEVCWKQWSTTMAISLISLAC